jgi:hypothetical protein
MAVISIDKPAPELISVEAFWDRFTQAETVNYEVAKQHNAAATLALQKDAAKLRIFQDTSYALGYVRVGKNKVATFVNSLESSQNGTVVLAAGRAATILNAPIADDEAYK